MASRRKGRGADAFDERSDYTLEEVDGALFGAIQDADRRRPVIRPVSLDEIDVDPEIQIRVNGLDEETVEQYTQILLNGGEFKDPVVLYRNDDAGKFILADGFHRCEATRRALQLSVGDVTIAPLKGKLLPGGHEAAVEYAEEANLRHGLKLSNEDKFNILKRRTLRGHDWTSLSDNALARELGVSNKTIARWRERIATLTNVKVPRERRTADGRLMKTSNIGGKTADRSVPSGKTPSPRRVTQHDGYDFNQDSGYEEGALDYGEPETWRDVRHHQPDLASSDGESAARRVNVALVALLNAVLETAAAIETMDADQDHFTADELRDIETSATEVLQYLRGYRSRQGQWVTGLLDLVDGLRRFAAQG